MRSVLFFICFYPFTVFAANQSGLMTDNLAQPADVVANFMWKASIILGATLLFAAYLKYMDYRINKNASPLRTVVILVILGALLTLVPLADSLIKTLLPYFFNIFYLIKSVIQQWILKY